MTPETLESPSKSELMALALALSAAITALEKRVRELGAKLVAPSKTPDNSVLPPRRGFNVSRGCCSTGRTPCR